MNEASAAEAFTNYVVPGHCYDELAGATGLNHWQSILRYFRDGADAAAAGSPAAINPEELRRHIHVRDWDVTRPWPLDPLPFSIDDGEWRELEDGLTQRATLLNLIVKDLYGPRRLLAKGGLPPALVFGNPRFLLPLFDYRAHEDTFLNLVAFDLGRGPDGRWRVLADWTEAPQGLGMCLENRMFTGQAMPSLFEQEQTHRLADFFQAFAYQLRRLAETAAADGITVILSPGPSHSAYFEHVYLGQYFGLPVVEGADLTVRGATLQLKTLEGLKPVGAVLRLPESSHCDPLYLNQLTTEGVAGLINAARNRQVHLANALGSGVVENDAFMSFLPGLCERLLDDELKLPSIATWWAGQPKAAAHIEKKLPELITAPAFTRPGAFLEDIQAFQTVRHEAAEPAADYGLVAREPIALSHAPYMDASGAIQAAPIVLRLFVGRLAQGYRLLPGGIARLSTADGELSKDIWVGEESVQPFGAPQDKPPHVMVRRSDRDLPSRTADDLFWLGRYLERCEGVVRTFRSLLNQMAESGSDERLTGMADMVHLLRQLDMITPAQARHLLAPASTISERDWWHILFWTGSAPTEAGGATGLSKLLVDILHLASQVRERLSADAWRMFNALATTPATEQWRVHGVADALTVLDGLIERLSALSGQIQENMTQSYGWRLLELGRRLERGHFVLTVLTALVNRPATSAYMYQLLALCDSSITYRARYQAIPRLDNLLHLLLLDETNPRSVVFQITRLQDVMREMPLDQAGEGLSESQRILLNAYHELTLADPQKLADVISKAGNRTQLRRVLQRLDKTLSGLSELVTATYFAHTIGSGQAR